VDLALDQELRHLELVLARRHRSCWGFQPEYQRLHRRLLTSHWWKAPPNWRQAATCPEALQLLGELADSLFR
jgi:hypothetical protein